MSSRRSAAAYRQLEGRRDLERRGRNTFGYGIMGASGISMASSNRSSGAYNPPRQPTMSAPPGIGRSA